LDKFQTFGILTILELVVLIRIIAIVLSRGIRHALISWGLLNAGWRFNSAKHPLNFQDTPNFSPSWCLTTTWRENAFRPGPPCSKQRSTSSVTLVEIMGVACSWHDGICVILERGSAVLVVVVLPPP
jgi:hypothetical protein